ncbi:zinc finger protein on ecdysone puffs isoform X2 [Zootermopsis nevadensis]|uniref:zinc finger protein on ecdysone puffs isoform X2 n=1 Tax=Zootermopsis nevadensis TaxID=136037 RepID=UPI000B8E8DD8|nr:zinc finger protein on ecdysone puffs isoform X2 [Zootermopsis nevadensis]
MSQNRGYRRDGRQSYQMNSSAHYGGRSGQQMNVNPWEGGLVPGGRSGVGGLLPTPPQSSNLLSQLSSPEAQLALASNLLSTLLRPQQPSPEVPSLLSLGSLGHLGNAPGGSGYRQHSGYGPGRYQDPGPNRRKRMESRRQEPYNKGRRPAPARGGPERKPGGSQGLRSPSIGKSRSGSGTKPGVKADRKDDDKEPKKDKDLEDDKSSGAEKKTDEEDVKRDEGEDGEKKRDWKDEKKSEELSGADKDENEDDKEEDEKDKGVEKVPASRYSGIPPSLFYCHVCKKHMWDENSFQNHLKGRTHQLMMDKLEESYKIRVELMRHEQKVAEQQREIEMERMKRQGKKVNMNIREYCTMCDLHFFGNLIVHRKNDRHQQLKNFLHPRCLPCGKEFPTRVEWDHHKLTPLHLKKTAEARKNRKSGSDDEFGIEELISGGGGFGDDFSKREIKVRTREEEEDEIKEADKVNETVLGKEKSGGPEKDEGVNKDAEGKDEGEATVIGNLRLRVPKYNPEVAVGLSLLKKMTGQTCRACHRFFINVEDAKTHCRTLMHYNNFVELIKEKAKAAEAKERREAKAEAKKREGSLESTEKAAKRTEDMNTVDDEGNWKRRKVANAEEDEDADADALVSTPTDGGKVSETAATTNPVVKEDISEAVPTNGSQKYDPLEADAEESNPEDENKGTQSQTPVKEEEEEEEDKVKNKKENSIVGDDNLWAEVDRDLGSILDTVDGEAETESLNDMTEDELLNIKQESDSPAKVSRNSTRNKATRGSLTPKTRGRKKK